MLLYWLSKRRKRERKQNTGNDPFILTNRKSAGEVSLRNITSSRNMPSLNHSLRKGGAIMLLRIIYACLIVGPLIMTNRTKS
ncbi:hypothetical protein CICLE_v10017710mg [Citrus x clementina]|uniref:Uncharacterized protein n=1 Tax=Citrus clementina TaxID=85681 RepID=V4U6F0_CITCL|nr:hypothetical protein CICLE_v10017710mg [Citrus x clementina]